jgi:hypothetical protein
MNSKSCAWCERITGPEWSSLVRPGSYPHLWQRRGRRGQLHLYCTDCPPHFPGREAPSWKNGGDLKQAKSSGAHYAITALFTFAFHSLHSVLLPYLHLRYPLDYYQSSFMVPPLSVLSTLGDLLRPFMK